MLDLKKIGIRISDLRKKYDMTQERLAQILYVTRQAVSRWETGQTIPTVETLCDLSILFGVSIDELIGNTEIDNDDFELLFANLPRQTVINRFLYQETHENKQKLFSFLTDEEKTNVIKSLEIKRKKWSE